MRIFTILTAALLLLTLGCSSVRGKSFTWTDGGKNRSDWFDAGNWSPQQVPGPDDDVTINTYMVYVDYRRPVTVKSVRLGCINITANECGYLQIASNFTVTGVLTAGVGTTLLAPMGYPYWTSRLTVGYAEIAGFFLLYNGELSGTFHVLSNASIQFMGGSTLVFVDARFNCSAPIPWLDSTTFVLKESSVIGITSTFQGIEGSSGVQAADNTDVVFDASGGRLNLYADVFYVNAPVLVGALSVSDCASVNITNGSLTITDTATVVRYTWNPPPPGLVLGPRSQLIVASGATLNLVGDEPDGAPMSVSCWGVGDLSSIVSHGLINVSGAALIQNVHVSGNGDVSVYGSLSVANSTFSQRRVTLLGADGEFTGEATTVGYVGVVSGSPFVNVTIGTETYSCPEQCDGISFTATNFRFIIGS